MQSDHNHENLILPSSVWRPDCRHNFFREESQAEETAKENICKRVCDIDGSTGSEDSRLSRLVIPFRKLFQLYLGRRQFVAVERIAKTQHICIVVFHLL